jgi:dephospho-CoA kinase
VTVPSGSDPANSSPAKSSPAKSSPAKSNESRPPPGLTVVLTGGIGSGKSTVASMLAAKGAALVDADAIAREVIAPDGPAFRPVVGRFGDSVVATDGTIDRQALAGVVFSDPQALADLNGITHPHIGRIMIERRASAQSRGGVIVLDIPLLRATHRDELGVDVVVVVDTPVEVAIERLVGQRGFTRSDAEARVGAQMSREERRALADFALDNSGEREDLAGQVERLWSDLESKVAARSGKDPL